MNAQRPFSPGSYRYPGEHAVLAITLTLVAVVIAVTAAATVCGSVLFVGVVLAMAYAGTRSQHSWLMAQARRVTAQDTPNLWALAQAGASWLGPGPVEIYVAPSRALNAYTFGLDSPKIVVIESALLRVLDADELAFVLSHELGDRKSGV